MVFMQLTEAASGVGDVKGMSMELLRAKKPLPENGRC